MELDTSGKRTAATGTTNDPAATDREPPGWGRILKTVVTREVETVVLQPSYAAILGIVALVVLGVAWSGGGIHGGYVPTVADLLTPLELLVPVVAIALGYRAIRNDEQRGELDVLETYPITSGQLVVGVYLGRALGLVLAVALPLALVMLPITVLSDPPPLLYATHSGADSPWLYLRFLVLTVLFALVVLAIAIAVSTVVSTTRTALVAAALALVVLLVGLDLAVAYGFSSGVIGEGTLVHSIAISPLSAYRGLVLETAVAVASGTGPQMASPLTSVAGLGVWGLGSLAVAIRTLR